MVKDTSRLRRGILCERGIHSPCKTTGRVSESLGTTFEKSVLRTLSCFAGRRDDRRQAAKPPRQSGTRRAALALSLGGGGGLCPVQQLSFDPDEGGESASVRLGGRSIGAVFEVELGLVQKKERER